MADTTQTWSYLAGEKGRNRVRVYEDGPGGILLLEYRIQRFSSRGSTKKRVSLGHRDRDRAKQKADEVAAALGKDEPGPTGDITLRELFDIYLCEKTPDKSPREQTHDHRSAEMFLRLFGKTRKPKDLNVRDQEHFIRERSSGRLRPARKKKATPVGNRTVTRGLRWLHTVLNWATVAGNGRGGVLLERNPLKGLPFPKEESPRRPLVTDERYLAMLQVAADVDWRCHVALVLAHETGHRIGAIRQLRWEHVDLQEARVRWDRQSDKVGLDHETWLTEPAVEALRRARSENPGIGSAWVLPSPTDSTRPCARNLARDWWYRMEELAGLDHVHGMGWHGLRRKFATELKDVPLPDLCYLGGWKSPQTILRCYQKPDEETMRRALERRKTVRLVSGG